MNTEVTLIERIYEAAAMPELWPQVFQQLADTVGAAGAALIVRTPDRSELIVSPRLAPDLDAYVAEGWAADTEHVAPLFDELYPGFRCETDIRSLEEIARLPVHAEFLGPRELSAGAGSILQGALDDSLQLAVQGFRSHDAAALALPQLDSLRAPLARAISLGAQLKRREAETAIAALDLTPAEARLTRLLAEGHLLAEAAAQLKISKLTARTHLRNVFGKTGVGRQTDLVRLLLGIGALV